MDRREVPVSLQRGHAVPFFEVETAEGARRAYRDVWQRRSLLLVSVAPPGADAAQIAARLRERVGEDAEVLVTSDPVEGMPRPGALAADRWGEIVFVAPIDPAAVDVEDLAEWVRFVQLQCPECEGEAR
jgi:hypothetical protein